MSYVLFKRYETRTSPGKWPDITKEYMSDPPPIVGLTRNIEEAYRADFREAKWLAYMTNMDYERV